MCEKENVQITDDMISKIIGAYQSDIRSMINFIQSNHRDLQISNIIPQELWKTLDKSESSEIFVKQVEEISEQYRIHKRQLLNHYCDYVIRNVNSRITRDFLNGVEQIVHNSEGIPVEVLVTYFAKIVVGNEAQN
jgi:replication factor C subunit 3/5